VRTEAGYVGFEVLTAVITKDAASTTTQSYIPEDGNFQKSGNSVIIQGVKKKGFTMALQMLL
jgi:hypothetical protein